MISIHALLAESDAVPVARRTSTTGISIHALLAESDSEPATRLRRESNISIHALLAESDAANLGALPPAPNFYPRSPCGERHHAPKTAKNGITFLSTLSLRRATF